MCASSQEKVIMVENLVSKARFGCVTQIILVLVSGQCTRIGICGSVWLNFAPSKMGIVVYTQIIDFCFPQ